MHHALLMTRKALAAALDVSPALVTKHARQGMPTDSVAAARGWREANLRGHMTKGNRITDAAPAAVAVARVHQLCPVSLAALEADRFDVVEAELRAALRAVPPSARGKVEMDSDLWDWLTRHAHDAIVRTESFDNAANAVELASISKAGADALGTFWYSVAAGEPPSYEGLL